MRPTPRNPWEFDQRFVQEFDQGLPWKTKNNMERKRTGYQQGIGARSVRAPPSACPPWRSVHRERPGFVAGWAL